MIDGVALQTRERGSKFLEHRGGVRLCGDLQTVLTWVSEPEHMPEWIPYTVSAKSLSGEDGQVVYHVVTRAPWPLRPRDMIYALDVSFDGNRAEVKMTGLPDFLPVSDDTVRMKAADGLWLFVAEDNAVRVNLQMWVDPGAGLGLLVNLRAASTLSRMLANLRSRYPCNADATSEKST